jgi:subtilase family serine protease
VVAGCIPDELIAHASGGSKAIALVDAYHYPYAKDDLTAFSTQFGLPLPGTTSSATTFPFQVVYASGSVPPTDPYGWEVEAALDLQWAHAMAPNAKLILVEAASNSFTDLNAAVTMASKLVAAAGGGEVSMSYGAYEFSAETAFESLYKTAKVVYFASSGDDDGTSYPCTSPNVVCVGGTTLRRNPVTKAMFQEISWQDGGSGISPYFARPVYQNAISSLVGAHRGVPDVSLVADPDSGVWVRYSPSDESGSGWWIVGGTSLSSPAFAGIVNSAAHFYLSSAKELTRIYAAGLGATSASMFRNISAGYCGPYVGWNATLRPKWDLCTGVGSALGKVGK